MILCIKWLAKIPTALNDRSIPSIECVHQSDKVFMIDDQYYRSKIKSLTDGSITVPDGGGSGVSSSIRSIKMYSCAQCAIQERSMCCRDVPCLADMEQGPDPLHPEHLPLP